MPLFWSQPTIHDHRWRTEKRPIKSWKLCSVWKLSFRDHVKDEAYVILFVLPIHVTNCFFRLPSFVNTTLRYVISRSAVECCRLLAMHTDLWRDIIPRSFSANFHSSFIARSLHLLRCPETLTVLSCSVPREHEGSSSVWRLYACKLFQFAEGSNIAASWRCPRRCSASFFSSSRPRFPRAGGVIPVAGAGCSTFPGCASKSSAYLLINCCAPMTLV